MGSSVQYMVLTRQGIAFALERCPGFLLEKMPEISKAHIHELNLRAYIPMQTKYGTCGVHSTVKVKDPLFKQ